MLGVTLIVFILRGLLPGSPARAILGRGPARRQIAAFNQAERAGPRGRRFSTCPFLGQLLHGNLGFSFKQNMSVERDLDP